MAIPYRQQLLIDMKNDQVRAEREKKEAIQNAEAKLKNAEYKKDKKNFYRSDT